MAIHSQDETSRSQPHRRVERILDQMQLSYESEVVFRPYTVDIYLGEFHVGLEIDGPQHSPKKDAKRDAELANKYFLPVMHIGTDVPVESVKIAVTSFIEQSAPSAPERKRAREEANNS